MKNLFFEGTVKYERVMENGLVKKVIEKVIVEALTVTEAEARIIHEFTPFIEGEYLISQVKRANLSEIFYSPEDAADKWYKCRLFFVTLDEKSGSEKKTAVNMLVQAADLRDAVKKLDEGMKGTMADYIIFSVADSNIIDVYPYYETAQADNDDNQDEE